MLVYKKNCSGDCLPKKQGRKEEEPVMGKKDQGKETGLDRPPAPRGAERILVVDSQCKNILSALETIPTEYELTTAENYEEALFLLGVSEFSYIFTNLRLASSQSPEIPGITSLMKTYGLMVHYKAVQKCESSRSHTRKVIVVIDENGDDDNKPRHHIELQDKRCHVHFIHPENVELLPDSGGINYGKILKGVIAQHHH